MFMFWPIKTGKSCPFQYFFFHKISLMFTTILHFGPLKFIGQNQADNTSEGSGALQTCYSFNIYVCKMTFVFLFRDCIKNFFSTGKIHSSFKVPREKRKHLHFAPGSTLKIGNLKLMQTEDTPYNVWNFYIICLTKYKTKVISKYKSNERKSIQETTVTKFLLQQMWRHL